MKKLFITLLSLCTMSAAVFAESDTPQGAMNIEGTLLWKIQGGTMTIYGDDYQPMRNYSSMSDELRHFAGHEFQTIDMTKGITIGNYAFSGLEKLESVNLHGTSTGVNPIYYIGKNAFEGSSNLTSINSEALTDLRYIGERAFAGTAIKSFTVKKPAGGELMDYVKTANGFPVDLNLEHCYIGNEAFAGCRYLSTVYMNDATPFTGTYNGFLYEHTYLVVDNANVAATYRAAWESIADRIIYLQQNVTFSSEAFKEICVNNWDTNGDGELSYEEAFAVTTFGDAFKGNTELKEITINDLKPFVNVTVYESGLFEGCTNLEKITISPFVTDIADDAFKGCTSLKEIHFVTEIPFKENFTIETNERTHIIVPDDYLATYDNTWTNKSALIIGESHIPFQCAIAKNACVKNWDTNKDGELSYTEAAAVKTLGTAFNIYWSMTSFEEFKYFVGLTSIETSAFTECTNLYSVTVPASVKSIGTNAFNNNYVIFESNTPITYNNFSTNSVFFVPDESLHDYQEAWYDIRFRILPISALKEGTKEFTCTAQPTSSHLADLIGEENLHKILRLRIVGSINSYDMMVINKKMTCLRELDLSATNIVANSYDSGFGASEDGVLNAFTPVTLKTLVLPESIHTIGANALKQRSYITHTLYVPDNVQYIGEGAFYSFKKLIKFSKDSKLERIGNNAFYLYGASSLELPASVTYIGNEAFAYSYLTSFNLTANTGNGIFKNCSKLKEVTIKDGTGAIGTSTFENCKVLEKVTIEGGLTEIPGSTFKNISSLHTVNISAPIKKIGAYAFELCSSLKNVTLPSTLTDLGSAAFRDCIALEKIELPIGVTSIESGTFMRCSALKDVRLSPKTTTLNSTAFYNCSSLTEFHLPPYLTTIGSQVFWGCTNLMTYYAYMTDVPVLSSGLVNTSKSELYVPAFLYNSYFYDEGWRDFLDVRKCNLRPGDYEAFYTNKDLYFKEGEERITLDRPIVELGNQGSIIVEGAEQEFTTVDMLRSTTSSSLIGDGNIVIDELRVKIEVAANRWYFLCFPYDVEIDGCEYPGKYAWRYYDGAVRAQNGSGGWKKIEGNKLTAGMGYIFQSNTAGNLIVKFSDPEFGGDRPVSLEAHNCTNAADASWNFVGNPYASYYNVEVEDFTSPITVWNGTTYVAYRPGDDDYHLQPYEAFFVQKTENDGAVNFEAERRETYTMSQATAAAKTRASRERGITPERLIVNLTISDNDTAVIDRTRLVMNAKASRNYETDCDASKFISDDAVAQIYTVEGTVKMAINERPGDGEVRLGYIASKKGTLRIEAQRMDVPMEIIDTETNTTHDLSEGAYVFTTKAGTFDKRFVIRTSRSATGIIGLTAATGVAIGMTDGGLTIGGAEGKTVGIHTVGGALVAEHNGNGHVALPGGTYVVTVDGYSTKVFVK